MPPQNHCEMLYQALLQHFYGAELGEFKKFGSQLLVGDMYGVALQSAALLNRLEKLFAATAHLRWIRGTGWCENDDTGQQIPLDVKNFVFFKRMFEPAVSLWTVPATSLRDRVDGLLLYRVDAYLRLLDWEQRYAGLPHPPLPQDAVRQIVQALTIFECRAELDLMYFSSHGVYGRAFRDGDEHELVHVTATAGSFAEVTSWFVNCLTAFEALTTGQNRA